MSEMEYPKQLFKRDNFIYLNGVWDYSINSKDYNKQIIVPFCFEAQGVSIGKKDVMYYRKIIDTTTYYKYDNVVLHLEGIMQVSKIYINGKLVGKSNNGYVESIINIKPYLLCGNNTIEIMARNAPYYTTATGKENQKQGGIWYSKVSGIYKNVWVEYYNNKDIQSINLTTSINGVISGVINGGYKNYTIEIYKGSKLVLKTQTSSKVNIQLENVELWSPSSPNLYDVYIKTPSETIGTYIAFREFKIKNKAFYLNGEKIFINGVLDQGYYKKGIYTPISNKEYESDLLFAKNCGFNAVRKHIKVESDYYYYLCDKLGIIVIQDFVNMGKYNFFTDTICGLLGVKIKKNVSIATKYNFLKQGNYIVETLQKHPCILYYNIFNEGWGEFDSEKVYEYYKAKYPQVIFSTCSGWFNQNKSDINSSHIYFGKLRVKKAFKENERPTMIDEYGGFGIGKGFAYKKCKDSKQLTSKIAKQINKLKKLGVAGGIYTQLYDVENETNGLISYDRKKVKVIW